MTRHEPSNSTPSSTTSSSRSRALISRIRTPFSSRPRHIIDLAVDTADPHRVYAPGDAVKGVVRFTALKPVRLTHVVLQIRGFVKVYRTATPPGEGVSSEAAVHSVAARRKGSHRAAGGHGYATIFEDEQVICGSGSLSEGRYEIPFNMPLPQTSLPSSLDFERGTICYVLTTILTRPVNASPTMVADRKIELRDSIDVGLMCEPKQKVVSLKPLGKRGKLRAGPRMEEKGRILTTGSSTSAERGGIRRSISEQSAFSSNSESRACGAFEAGEGADDEDPKRISASVELLRDGYLPGDLVPVRIMVRHTKPVKAMQGVIVTLYRRAKIDLLPTPDAQDGSDKDPSTKPLVTYSAILFSSSARPHNFRYDLDQIVEPLIINPNTMQGEVKTALKIPEDVFPSISSVPNGHMSFTYHIEVVMDLIDKMAGIDRILPRLGITRAGPRYSGLGELGSDWGNTNHGSGSGEGILDTSSIRRLGCIAQCTFDIVVGTKDSKRQPAKRATDAWTEAQKLFGQESPREPENASIPFERLDRSPLPGNSNAPTPSEHIPTSLPVIPPPEPEEEPVDEKARIRRQEEQLLPSQPPGRGSDDPADIAESSSTMSPSAPPLSSLGSDALEEPSAPAYHSSHNIIATAASPFVPPPTDSEETVDEKTRLRRAENALLPSAPDDEDELEHGPTDEGEVDDETANDSRRDMPPPSAPPAHELHAVGSHLQPADNAVAESSSAPPYVAAPSPSSAALAASNGDDKQELERRRLQTLASSPDDDDAHYYDDENLDVQEPDHATDETLSAPGLGQPTVEQEGSEDAIRLQNTRAEDMNESLQDHNEQAIWEGVEGSDHLPRYMR